MTMLTKAKSGSMYLQIHMYLHNIVAVVKGVSFIERRWGGHCKSISTGASNNALNNSIGILVRENARTSALQKAPACFGAP
jgi:hypothetical protein